MAQRNNNSTGKRKQKTGTGRRTSASSSTGKRRTSSGRTRTSSGQRRNSSARSRSAAAARNETEGLGRDIAIALLILFSIIILLSSFGLCGPAGRAISSVTFGLFGLPAYIFPILLFFVPVFWMANRHNRTAARKIRGLIGVFLFTCAFFQLILKGYSKSAPVLQSYRESSYDKSGGGLVGGFIVKVLGTVFGSVGAAIIIIAAIIIFSIIMTQKPILSELRESGADLIREAKERREEKERTRAAEKVEEHPKKTAAKRRQPEDSAKKDNSDSFSLYTLEPEKENEQISFDTEAPAFVPDPIPDDLIAGGAPGEKSDADRKQEDAATLPEDPDWIPGTEDTVPPQNKTDIRQQKRDKKKRDDSAVDDAESRLTAAIHRAKEKTAENAPAAVPASSEKPGIREEDRQTPVRKEAKPVPYVFPPTDLLDKPDASLVGDTNEHLRANAAKLQETLHSFGVEVTITHISCGPTVTRYEMHPQQGVKVSKILSLQDDIKLNMAAADIRIEAPIPGKAAIGIEIPNKNNVPVKFRELLESDAFRKSRAKLAFAVGKDIAGMPVVSDISKMTHLLIAGATGSGKSVCINTLIMSLIYKMSPEQVRLIMIDPKVVELSVYNGIPHLLTPVVTEPKKAIGALNWAIAEMNDRYKRFYDVGARDINGYNEKIRHMDLPEDGTAPKPMARIVIIVDELADLMLVARNEIEDAIKRLTALARAAGIHLVMATQRPSVDVITGVIKANIPSRIALAVTSGVDSKTILDMTGAEKLLGKGDMLFYPMGYQKPVRVQGAFISDDEITRVVDFLKKNSSEEEYDREIEEKMNQSVLSASAESGGDGEDTDAYFADAGRLIIQKDKASIGMLQRAFRIGFNRAARIMDQLCDAGVVGAEAGTKPREILMSMEQFENYLEEH